tara:strand:- start:3120 stop:3458 length:339 start_codon:yes stop_codon:yes gene_type:complete
MTTWNNLNPVEAAKTQKQLEYQENLNKMTGVTGAVLLHTSGANLTATGNFFAIQGIKAANVDFTSGAGTQTLVTGSNMDQFTIDFMIPDGATIYGNFSKVTLASGYAIAYKK